MASLLGITVNIIGPIFLIVGLSVLIDRLFAPDPRVLSRLVIYLFTPCLVLDSLAHSSLQAEEMGQIVAMAVLSVVTMVFVGWVLGRVLGFDRKLAGGFMLSVALMNAGNYGIPLNDFAFGQDGLQRAVIFYVATSVCIHTLGVFLASRGSAPVGRSLLNVLMVPVPYAIVIGLALNATDTTMPFPITRAVRLVGQAAVPCMIVILGLKLSRTSIKGRLGPVLLATGTRLLIGPALAFALAALLGLSGVTRQVCIIEASMPTAVMTGVLATEFGSDAEFTAATILLSTLVSFVTLSVLLWVVM
jgi:predicted permease